MKISKLFHWLYAIIMILPVAVIPIFAIYSHRHQINSYSIDVPQKEVVDFNQLAQLNFENNEISDVVLTNNNNELSIVGTATSSGGRLTRLTEYFDLKNGHQYYFDFPTDYIVWYIEYDGNHVVEFNSSPFILTSDVTTEYGYIGMNLTENITYNVFGYLQFFDLTQMFGSGSEPSIETFESIFTDVYYPYVLSRNELVNVGTISYNDTDIGSQMLYSFYNTTDKYFALNKLFGLGGLYDWFLLNMFGGNCPLGFTIFWNLLTYWLIISIFWLLFDVMIYVPQLVHRWLDKGVIE